MRHFFKKKKPLNDVGFTGFFYLVLPSLPWLKRVAIEVLLDEDLCDTHSGLNAFFKGCQWVSTEFYRVFTRFYRVSHGFRGFYWILRGSTGFYRVLLGFTGFY